MEFRYAKYFVVLAELQHFNRAAEKLNITQPSLSRGIQKLELLVGGKLFSRDSKNISMTHLGTLVLTHCQRILKEYDTLNKELSIFHNGDKNEIKIGSSPIPSNSLVGPILGQFLESFPAMSVDLKVAGWEELTQRLLEGSLDLFVAETRATELELNSLLKVVHFPSFQVIFCCRAEHPLAQRCGLMLSELKDYPLAIPRHLPHRLADEFEDLFLLHRDDFAGLVRFDQFYPIKESLCSTDLIGLAPAMAVREELANGSLVRLFPAPMPQIEARFSIVTLAEKSDSLSLQTLTQLLLQRAHLIHSQL